MTDVRCILLNVFVLAIVLLSITMCAAKTKNPAQVLAREVDNNNTPGVAYIHFDRDGIVYSNVNGWANVKEQRKMTLHTRLHAFSVTKTITALAILQLQEQGLLDIDDPASRHLPVFPYNKDITIRQLLTHTAGIKNPKPLNWVHSVDEHERFNSKAFFSPIFTRHSKLKSAPGTKMSYSNLGYVLLGDIIEAVSGKGYEEYITEHVFSKMNGEHRPGFRLTNTFMAKGYQKRWSFMNLVLGFLIDKKKLMGKSEGRWKPFNDYYLNGSAYGGLITSAEGMAQYGQALLQGRLVQAESMKELFAEQILPGGKPAGMGMSWFTGQLNGHRYVHHAGGGGGYYVEFRLYPDINRGSIVMFNRSGMKDEKFLDKVDAGMLRR